MCHGGSGIPCPGEELRTGDGEALECSRKACELEPNNAVRWVLLGLVYYRLEQYAEGLEVANKALELDPTNEDCQKMKDVFQQKVNEG